MILFNLYRFEIILTKKNQLNPVLFSYIIIGFDCESACVFFLYIGIKEVASFIYATIGENVSFLLKSFLKSA